MKLKPLYDRVVIEPIEVSNKTELGVYLPDDVMEKPQTGKVISVGDGLYQNGVAIPLTVKSGNTVMFESHSGIEIKDNGKKFIVIREVNIIAIVER